MLDLVLDLVAAGLFVLGAVFLAAGLGVGPPAASAAPTALGLASTLTAA